MFVCLCVCVCVCVCVCAFWQCFIKDFEFWEVEIPKFYDEM